MKIKNKIITYWRLSMITIGFFIFGIGSLILSLIVLPINHLLNKNINQRIKNSQKIIKITFRGFLKFLKIVGVLDYSFHGFEKLNNDTDTIIIANHPSLLDYVFLGSLIDQCICVVKNKLLDNFFVKRIIKSANYIPNNDPEQFMNLCQKMIKPNDHLLIFPEGTRTQWNHPIILQRGASNIALRTHKDIRVVHIDLNTPFLTKTHKWYQVPVQKPVFKITVHDKISIEKYLSNNQPFSINSRKLTHDITELFNSFINYQANE